MTRLKERLIRMIEAEGPIGVDRYMALCLFDPADGYYTTREPFGVKGDFVTAPEISQMFGEIVAIWLHQAWEKLGRPTPVTLAEIGPGRGTLTADMLRTLSKIGRGLLDAADVALIEVSPRLAAIQRDRLTQYGSRIAWHVDLSTLPRQPLLIVGNELFDAIPTRQFARMGGAWRERMVGLVGSDLAFVAGADILPDQLAAAGIGEPAEGAVFETAPAREAMVQSIAGRIAGDGGAGLFFDYGHVEQPWGNTLQAVKRHAHDGVFDHPGEADLTSHVDFAALAAVVRGHGLDARVTTQGDFLLGMGLLQRAGALGSAADEATREAIRAAVERLAGPDQMGTLFKVLGVLPTGLPVVPFISSD